MQARLPRRLGWSQIPSGRSDERKLIHLYGFDPLIDQTVAKIEYTLTNARLHRIKSHCLHTVGARGGQLVEALRYKPEGRGFDSRWDL